MSHAWLVALMLSVLSLCNGEEFEGDVTIVQLGMLTHVVYLSSSAGHCSGSIISEEFVLTSAHCLMVITTNKVFGRFRTYSIDLVPHDGVTVKAGVVDMTPVDLQHQQTTFSEEVIIHPHFRPMKLAGYDIGLVRVSPPFNFSDVVFRVELSEKGWTENENRSMTCQTSGFGDMSNAQAAMLKMWDVKAHHGDSSCPCAKRFQWKRLVCTSAEGQPRMCKGDSGASLICEDKAVAVSHMVRDHKTCDNLDYPKCSKNTLNTYMYLCPLNDWIKKYVPVVPPTPKSCIAPRTQSFMQLLQISFLFLSVICLMY